VRADYVNNHAALNVDLSREITARVFVTNAALLRKNSCNSSLWRDV
jgi:hypothetical protein